MRRQLCFLTLMAIAAVVQSPFAFLAVAADGSGRMALTGVVSSTDEGPMEGVLVSARQDGSTISTTVVTDDHGRYSFPSTKMSPGHYAIRIRGVGYDLDGPKTVDVGAAEEATADLKLRKAKNIVPQLEGSLWIAMMYQGGIARFEKNTGKFKIWTVPSEFTNNETQQSMVGAQHWEVDGKVWLNDVGIPGVYRMDMTRGRFERWAPYKDVPGPHSVYGIYADSKNNLYFLDFGGENVGKIDAKTGKVTLFPTPTPRSRPRRGRMDAQDRLWFAEFYGGKIGPSQTNVRRIFVDNSTTPVTFWVGNNESASIVKLEPVN